MAKVTTPIAIACDHAGFELKEFIKRQLEEDQIPYKDFGAFSTESVDYPDMIHPLASAINQGTYQFGIILCGSGNGVAMTANKYEHVRAAICWNAQITELARKHNDANVISLPARFISMEEGYMFVKIFLNTAFEGGRHQHRVDKIALP